MLRLSGPATVVFMLVLGALAGDQPDSNVKEFTKDIEQLNGSWMSPKMELAPGVTGRFQLKLEFKKFSTVGQATVLNFASKNGIIVNIGPWIAELKAKDKKYFLILAETKLGKRVEKGEIAYEINGDKLKFTSPKGIQFEHGGRPIEMTGEWQRKKAAKKSSGFGEVQVVD